MNIYDISSQAGVSIATVSRVLNGSEKVSPATRQKVLDVIEKNGYTPNAFARSLSSNTMSTVGILCSDASDVYQAQAIYYLEGELRRQSYTSMLCCTGHALSEKADYLQLLLSRNVDALFLIGSHFVESTKRGNSYILNAAKRVPVFLLNGKLIGDNIFSILCDDESASRDITNLLFDRGARSPIYLYRALNYSGRRKIRGFCAASRARGITGADKLTFSCPGPVEQTCRILESIRKKGISFDAVAAADDELATGAVKYALRNSMRIPEDFQVTGYNHSVLATCSTPEITTLDNRVEYMCTTAVNEMMQVLDHKNVPPITSFSGSIIEYASTRKEKED